MANIKISELTALTPPDATDLVPVTDSSASQTKRTTVGEIVGIINGDVDVADNGTATISELPVSKLQDGAARQLLQTDAAGTGVEWTSNVDVPGTLDVTGAATLDDALNVAGLASLDGGIDVDGAFTVANTSGNIATSGTLQTDGNGTIGGDLTVVGDLIAVSGNVGIGTETPGGNLHVQGATDSSCSVYLTDGDATGTSNSLLINKSGTITTITDRQAGSTLVLGTADQERLTVNSTGYVGINASYPTQFLQVNGAIVATGAAATYSVDGIYLQNKGSSLFDVSAWRSGANAAILTFSTDSGSDAAPVERVRITNAGVIQVADAGNIAVGTTTGTKVGTATTQKLGFYNATPVAQPAAIADATDAASAITQLNALLSRMRNLGLIAS